MSILIQNPQIIWFMNIFFSICTRHTVIFFISKLSLKPERIPQNKQQLYRRQTRRPIEQWRPAIVSENVCVFLLVRFDKEREIESREDEVSWKKKNWRKKGKTFLKGDNKSIENVHFLAISSCPFEWRQKKNAFGQNYMSAEHFWSEDKRQ